MTEHRHMDSLVYGIALLTGIGGAEIPAAHIGVISHYVLKIANDRPDLVPPLLGEANEFAPMGDAMQEAIRALIEDVEEGGAWPALPT